MNLEQIIDIPNWKLSVAKTQFEAANINNVSKINFELKNLDDFLKETTTLRDEQGKLYHRRGRQGSRKRLKNLERDFFYVNNKIFIPTILEPFTENLIKYSKVPEYILELDLMDDRNIVNISKMLDTKNPEFNELYTKIKKPGLVTSETKLLDTTNKHWNMSNNKYDWFNIMYLYNFDDQLKYMLQNNFSKDTIKRSKSI